MKGQSSVLDAIIFMVIISGAVTMLIYVSGLYSSSTQQQVLSSYSYEYAGNALVALHYAVDDGGNFFWGSLREKSGRPERVTEYLKGECGGIISDISRSSPARDNFLCIGYDCFNLSEGGVTQKNIGGQPSPCGGGLQSYSYRGFLGRKSVSFVLCY